MPDEEVEETPSDESSEDDGEWREGRHDESDEEGEMPSDEESEAGGRSVPVGRGERHSGSSLIAEGQQTRENALTSPHARLFLCVPSPALHALHAFGMAALRAARPHTRHTGAKPARRPTQYTTDGRHGGAEIARPRA